MIMLCSCDGIITMVPFILTLLWPILGVICGGECLTRQCMVLIAYFIITDFTEKLIKSIFKNGAYHLPQFISTLIFIALITQPYRVLPSFVITLIPMILKLLTPFVILIEAKQTVRIIKLCGERMSDEIHDNSNDDRIQLIWKCVVILIALFSYGISGFIIHRGLINAQTLMFTHISLLLIVIQMIVIIATIYKDEGIVSDASLVCLASVLSLYIAINDYNLGNSKLTSASFDATFPWLVASNESLQSKSLMRQLLDLPDVSTAYASEGLRWARHHYGLQFWIALIIRISCLLTWIIDQHYVDYHDRNGHSPDDDDDDNDDDDDETSVTITTIVRFLLRPLSTATLMKILSTLCYAQLILQQLPYGDSSIGSFSCPFFWRMLQSLALGIYYFYTLFLMSSDDN